MAHCGWRLALVALTCMVAVPLPLAAQQEFKTTVRIGSANDLSVEAVYRDPVDIDRELKDTRVIPMWLKVTNVSARPMPLAYKDVTLDVADAGGALNRFQAIDPAAARAMLQADGSLNRRWRRFLRSQDRFTTIDPFGRVLRDGNLAPRQSREGYVFFLRPEGTTISSFLVLGVAAHPRAVLATNDFVVMSPDKESSALWPDTLQTWMARFRERRAQLSKAISEIVNGPPPYRKSYALLMGVSDYANLQKLPLVKNDLDRMSELLRQLGFTVIRVENEKLTMANVKSPQAFFEKVAGITEEDRLLVFFAGHGYQRREGDRVRGYLALMNGRTGEGGGANAIAMDDFVEWTQRVPAKHLLVLLESCFSGLAVRARDVDVQLMGESEPDPEVLFQLSNARGRYLVMAGDDTQRVPMSERWNGGLFAHAVVEGLKGSADGNKDGFVTARELYPWLRTYVQAESSRVLGSSVTPLFKDLYDRVSTGEFVFTTPR
jgi:Caspase domain